MLDSEESAIANKWGREDPGCTKGLQETTARSCPITRPPVGL
jgi:hypothetical protein